ncbi:MAG: hypothetical protein GXP29_09280 [Planctomycetes bacterium]|nr:hypothetical protein [Planctomycetota bacterium]
MQKRAQKNRPGLIRFVGVVVLLGFSGSATPLAAQVGQNEPETDPKIDADAALLQAWSEAVDQVAEGKPWPQISADLHAATQRFSHSKYAERCSQLEASIDLAAQTPAIESSPTNESSITELIAAIHLAKLDYRLVLIPNQYYDSVSQFVWEYYLERRVSIPSDPAHVLYTRGRLAIEPLIDLLDDVRATRGAGRSDDGFIEPFVIRVCDVALGLIEGISGCTFKQRRGDLPLISQWPANERAELIQMIRDWWAATKSLSRTDAVLWQIEHGPKKLRINMVDTLIARKDFPAALSYLQKSYRTDDSIDAAMAGRMMRAGSREPLDFIHRLVAKGGTVDRKIIRLIAHFGDSRDFELLRGMVEATAGTHDRESADRLQVIVDALRAADERQAILGVPVHVAVIKVLSNEWMPLLSDGPPQHAPPPLLDTSIRGIQRATGIGFGLTDEFDVSMRARACRDIVSWWALEGEGAYGLRQNKPHAPVGIR